MVRCSTILKDGRFATGSWGSTTIVFNDKTFKPDIIVKENKGVISYILQLSSDDLASSSSDKTIKIFSISENNYQLIQTLKDNKDSVNTIIELKNKQFISCSIDKSINIYNKDNNEY